MKKKKEYNNKLFIPIGIVVIVVLLAISLLLERDNQTLLKDIGVTLEKAFVYPFFNTHREKERDQSKSYLIQKNVNSALEKEISELKDELELNKTLTEYTPINATILNRNKSYWFNTITIDKGKNAGIKKDMAVITKNGLIGKISKVSNTSSEVKLITSDDVNFKVSVAIRTNNDDNYAILNGYSKKTGLIKASGIDKTTQINKGASGIDKTTQINKGDTVLTSGLGGMIPAGIYIGTVEKIESDKYNLSKNVYIKTYQDFNDIHYITVLKVKA